MKNNKRIICMCVLLFGMFSFLQNVKAQEEKKQGTSISPFFQEIRVKDIGNKTPFVIEVKNENPSVMIFRISVLDFGALDESGGVAFLGASDNLKYALASWINLENDSVVIAPGETKTVKGEIENRDSLSPGGHYAAVYFNLEENDGNTGKKANVAFDTSFASLLFVRKVGGETYGLNLKNIDFSAGIFSLPSLFGLRFQNFGNVHVLPRGTIEIFDPLGREIKKGIINEQSGIILPETFRVFKTTMMNLDKAFFPGKYKIEISYRYDGRDDFSKENRKLFFVPPLFVGSIFALLILIFGITSLNKKNKNENIKK